MSRVSVPLIDYQLEAEVLLMALESAVLELEGKLSQIAALPADQRTFANTPEALEQAVADFSDAGLRLGILKEVHPDPALREAAAQAEERMGQIMVQVASRRDLYRAVKSWLDHGQMEPMDAQQRRLVELMMRDFRRNGLELADDKLARLVELRQRMTTLSTQFQQNLNENLDHIVASAEELEGLPESFVQRLEEVEGGRKVSTQYPDYVPFMENARNEAARERLYLAFNTREKDRNLPILQEVLKLRHEAATLLGYKSHADYVTEDRMAGSAARVADFLNTLRTRLRTLRDDDYRRLTALKREQSGDSQAQLQPWDVSYYFNQLRKNELELDTEALRAYFPLNTVLAGMFGIYETLFGIRIVEQEGGKFWDDSVRLYQIHEAEGGEHLASFYTDLFPRPGKYGHAAVAATSVARDTPQGYRRPQVLLLANFNPPSKERPSLLSHEEVRTLFHEFGHVVHQTLTTARYGSQSGYHVAGDFVETPSQMLENWVFDPEVLAKMSGHHENPEQKLPAETIEKLQKSRIFGAGYRYTRQVFLATFDQALHLSGETPDIQAIDRQLFRDILGLKLPEESCFAASFGHLLGGYDAGYYGYLWSEVFSADLFTRFEEEGVLNPELGRRYRDIILARGRTVEADELMREFLEREPNEDALLRQLGMN